MKKFQHAGMPQPLAPNRVGTNTDNMPTLEARIEHLLHIVKQTKRQADNMLFFVMYDIESNKVRNQIVKYLLKNGCTRIQKSIFLADLPLASFEMIKKDLTEVQACYENNDSILVVPISTDYLQAMKVIGQTIEIDIITHTKNTLFF